MHSMIRCNVKKLKGKMLKFIRISANPFQMGNIYGRLYINLFMDHWLLSVITFLYEFLVILNHLLQNCQKIINKYSLGIAMLLSISNSYTLAKGDG